MGHAWLTYSDIGYVYVFDRDLQQTFRLDHQRYHVMASAFPGLTRDGRVIYAATWQECADAQMCSTLSGYVVVDPYQSIAYRAFWQQQGQMAPKACITKAEARLERARFAKQHGLEP